MTNEVGLNLECEGNMKRTIVYSIGLGALAAVLMSAGMAAAQGCTPSHPGVQTVNAGALTPAMIVNPPISNLTVSGELEGIDGEILKEIAAMECLKVEPLTVDQAAAIQAVTSGRADLAIGGWFRTAARAEIVALSDPLYLQQMALVSRTGVTSVAGLADKKVGIVQGTLWAEDVKQVLGDKVTVYPSAVAMYQDLFVGRIDVAINGLAATIGAKNAGTLSEMEIKVIEPHPGIKASMEPGQAGFPLTKDNAALLQMFNDDLAKLRESGKIVEILVKYGLEASAADTGAPRLLK